MRQAREELRRCNVHAIAQGHAVHHDEIRHHYDAERLRMTRKDISGAIRHDTNARNAWLIDRITTGRRGGESRHGPPLPAARHASAPLIPHMTKVKEEVIIIYPPLN